jgi:hypothetical protein
VFNTNLKSLLYCLESLSEPKTKVLFGTLRNQEKSNELMLVLGKSLVRLGVIVFVTKLLLALSLLSLFIDKGFTVLTGFVPKLYEKNFSELPRSIKVLNIGKEEERGA